MQSLSQTVLQANWSLYTQPSDSTLRCSNFSAGTTGLVGNPGTTFFCFAKLLRRSRALKAKKVKSKVKTKVKVKGQNYEQKFDHYKLSQVLH